jgi:hypothetical protein
MTKKIKTVVYGLGGHDESKPNNNVIEIIYYTKDELTALEAEETKAAEKQAILDRIGLTADEVKLLLG